MKFYLAELEPGLFLALNGYDVTRDRDHAYRFRNREDAEKFGKAIEVEK